MKRKNQSFKEKNLLSRAQRGDESAFWELWLIHHSEIQTRCNQILKHDPIASEVAYSKVMFKIQKILPIHARRITHFRNWVLRITENVCIDEIRKSPKFVQFGDLDDMNLVAGLGLYDSQESEKDLQDAEKEMTFLLNKIRELPKKYRYVLLFRCCFEKTYSEISLFFQITNDTCRKRFELAKRMLRQLLSDHSNSILDVLLTDQFALRKSSLWFSIENEITILEKSRKVEVNFEYQSLRIIPRPMLSGLTKYSLFFYNESLDQKRTKLETLKKYILRHPKGWRKRLELARLLLLKGSWNHALIELTKVIKFYPSNIEARMLLCYIHDENDQPQKAIDILKGTQPLVLNKASKYFINGMIQYYKKEYEKAVSDFNFASLFEQLNPLFPFMEAVAHLHNNGINAAKLALEQSLKLYPENLKAKIISSDIFHFLGNDGEIEKLMLNDSQNPFSDPIGLKKTIKLRCRRRLVFGRDGKITRSLIKKLRTAAGSIPMSHEVQIYYYFYRGEWNKVLEYLKQIPDNPGKQFFKIKWYLNLGDYKKSRQLALDFFSRYGSTLPGFLFLASEVFFSCKQVDLAVHALKFLYKNNSLNLTQNIRLLRILVQNSTELIFVRNYSFHLLSIHQDIPELYIIYSEVLLYQKQYSKAQRFLIRAWQLLGATTFSRFQFYCAKLLIKCYTCLGDIEQKKLWYYRARMSLSSFISYYPAKGYFERGLLEIEYGRKKKSYSSFKKALDYQLRFPDREIAINHLKSKIV